MGRKKIPRKKAREVISITLPRDLVIDFDKKFRGIRSRAIERLMRTALLKEGQTVLGASVLYGCRTCSFEGRSARRDLTYCRSCQDTTLFVVRVDLEEEE
jgi:metal-responsive CopG/Arc/MetJ family transcriptional regulator